MRSGLKGNLGFSLIELMVVMAIMGILTAIATSYWRQIQGRARDIQALSDASLLFVDLIDAYNENKEIEFNEDIVRGWIGTPPIRKLSTGVVGLITPGSACRGRDGGSFEGMFYNEMGTRFGIVPRQYYIYIDDNEGIMEKTF